MRKVTIINICLLFFLTACERLEPVELHIPFKSKIVMQSVIKSGQSQAVLMLTRTRPVLGEPDTIQEPEYVKDALVVLVHNNQQYDFVYDTLTKRYLTDLNTTNFEPGERYDIQVTTSNEKISGHTRVPQPPNIQCTVSLKEEIENGVYYVRAYFKYKLLSASTNVLLAPTIVTDDSTDMPLSIKFFEKPILFVKQGETVEQVYQTGDILSFFEKIARVKVTFAACDDAYADFYNSYVTSDNGSFGYPFTQPKIARGNTSNGIGMVGSFVLSDEMSFAIK